MVSTLKFHGLKEIDFSKRKPFWILVAFVIVIAIMVIHPAIAMFVFAMIYLAEGLLENAYMAYRKRAMKTAEVKK
jgi:CDP-diacylglycerol--serine O-phosphatidyltransferase